jgi:hypothetical protein
MSGFRTDQNGLYIISSPGDTLDYSLDWTALLQASETIASSSWAADTGVTLGAQSYFGTVTTVFAGGGVDGGAYRLTNTITTSGGRTFARAFQLRIHSGI